MQTGVRKVQASSWGSVGVEEWFRSSRTGARSRGDDRRRRPAEPVRGPTPPLPHATPTALRVVLREFVVCRQVVGTIWFHFIEMLNLIRGEPLINRRMQYRVRINLAQRFGIFESSTEISRLPRIMLRAACARI